MLRACKKDGAKQTAASCSLPRPITRVYAPPHPPRSWVLPPPAAEEFVNKGDVLNEAISHPDKYTERFVALNVARPLLGVLAYMHANNIIHRCAAACPPLKTKLAA